MKILTTSILILLVTASFGQDIQWASKITIEFNTSLAKEGKSSISKQLCPRCRHPTRVFVHSWRR